MRESTGGTVWRENTRGKTAVVWTCPEEKLGVGLYWETNTDDGIATKGKREGLKRRFTDAAVEE